jgi:polyisoprenyl-phosphate glycosyltransferase
MSFSILIPAYNEAERIGRVLAVALQTPGAGEIIVVDDGSTDETSAVVRVWQQGSPRLHLLTLVQNQGKAGAVVAGANQSQHDVIVLLDADLVGLQPAQIQALADPVLHGRCAMSAVVLRQANGRVDWAHWPTAILSGQRCLRWRLFRHCAGLKQARWSIEVALNLHARQYEYPVAWVDWYSVGHVSRTRKAGWLGGIGSIAAMWLEIGWYVMQQQASLSWPRPARMVRTGDHPPSGLKRMISGRGWSSGAG